LSRTERIGVRAVPLVDLQFAAGAFGESQSLENDADE
jgi:hypothetical protein